MSRDQWQPRLSCMTGTLLWHIRACKGIIPVHIKRVELEGFRGISRLEMHFNRDITVLIGRNGIGKTSVLDAMACVLTAVQNTWPTDDSPGHLRDIPLEFKDRKIGQDDGSVEVTFELDGQVRSGVTLAEVSIGTSFSHNKTGQVHPSLYNFWKLLQNTDLRDQPRTLMVYYRQDRGFENSTYVSTGSSVQQVINTSLQGDLQALSNLQTWWDKRDAEEARNVRDRDPAFRDPQLEAIRAVIKEIDGFEAISFSSAGNEEGLFFKKVTGDYIHISKLSSGEKSFIILLADLGRRLQVVSPFEKLGEISGIVLIDEIELNLHPHWQSKIIPTLRRVFSSCQFIITTHSPQVVSAIDSDHVTIMYLDEDGVVDVQKPLRTKGQTSNYLLEGVFGASERYPESDNLIDAFNMAIDRKDFSRAEELLERITRSIEGEPPEMFVLRKRLDKLQANR